MAAFLRNRNNIHLTRSLFSTLSATTAEKPSISSFRKVKSSLKHESNPEKLAEIFQNSSNFSRFSRDRALFDRSVEKLSKLQRFDLIEQIFEYQKSSPVRKSEGFWIRIMMLYSKTKMVDQAVSIFNQMEDFGIKRTEKSLSALLSVFLENRQFDKILESMKSIPGKIGVKPGIVSYNIVLKASVSGMNEKDAKLLLEKLERENGVKPDINSYNILLRFHSNDQIKFDEIVKKISLLKLEPNLVTYNLRISSLFSKGDSIEAKKLFDEMVGKGIKPNLSTFNTLIEGFSKLGDFESAKKIFESMGEGENSVSPNSDTYFAMISNLVEREMFDSALDICKKSFKKHFILPFETMEALVNGLVKISKVDEAKEIIEKMKKRLKGSAIDSWANVESRLSLS